MGKKLSHQELKLYKAIDEILWKDWDPIGISGAVEARDEYQMYLPQAYKLALIGDRAKIADYLFTIAVERMGFTTQRNKHLAIADKILAAKSPFLQKQKGRNFRPFPLPARLTVNRGKTY